MASYNAGGIHSVLITLPLYHTIINTQVSVLVLSFLSLLNSLGFFDRNHVVILSILLFYLFLNILDIFSDFRYILILDIF
jgi:hypothetical protein